MGSRAISGTCPGMVASSPRATGPAETRSRCQQSTGIGMGRRRKEGLDGRLLDHLSSVHDDHPGAGLGDHCQIVGNQQHRQSQLLAKLLQQLEDLSLDGDIEGRGRLVGNQEIGFGSQRDSDHHPLSLSARELMGVVLETLARRRDGDQIQQPLGFQLGLPPRDTAMHPHGLGDLEADGKYRVQGRHRLLEDHPDTRPSHRAHPGSASPRRSSPESRIRPPVILPGSGISRRMARAVMLLPEPDSPTRPTNSPSSTLRDTPLTTGTQRSPTGKETERLSTASNVSINGRDQKRFASSSNQAEVSTMP